MLERNRRDEKTGFQEGSPYDESIDLQTDFVMVYGIGKNVKERITKWKSRGYVVHLMTGIAWGQYQDYLNGLYDGRRHWDEAQRNRHDKNIIHGTSEDVPYMVPTIAYTDFLTERIRAAVDAGVEAIHLEEPEFWVEGGYSEAFKREWEIYYKEPWQPPHESEDAQYRASRLKVYLYTRCLERLSGTLKEYAKVQYHRDLRFYVPTHSLINYTQWRIISPESRLIDVATIDGYIAQIWTGTSRTPNVYEGIRKERTFETSFLEYGIMQELTRGTGRRMWFLHDPIEDNPTHTWEDYRHNYLKTVIASLLHPEVSRYEVCPWPNRIYNRSYLDKPGGEKIGIPDEYASTLSVLMNTLADMEQSDVRWDNQRTEVGLLLSDSAMYQRSVPRNEAAASFKYDGTVTDSAEGDEFNELLDWSPFYGLALPLLKYGIPVRPVQLDNVRRFPSYLDQYRVFILSYEFMKPEAPDLHNALAEWVRLGGLLIYVGDGSDSFHKVRSWWNTGRRQYDEPVQHLMECMGLSDLDKDGTFFVGKGIFTKVPLHPSSCAHHKDRADELREAVRSSMEAFQHPEVFWAPGNALVLRRGPYVIASVMDESVHTEPARLAGKYVNLFDSKLGIVSDPVVHPGEQRLLYDLGCISKQVQLLAAGSRISNWHVSGQRLNFTACGAEGVNGTARIRIPAKPTKIQIDGRSFAGNTEAPAAWDEASSTVFIRYDNHPNGSEISIIWKEEDQSRL